MSISPFYFLYLTLFIGIAHCHLPYLQPNLARKPYLTVAHHLGILLGLHTPLDIRNLTEVLKYTPNFRYFDYIVVKLLI